MSGDRVLVCGRLPAGGRRTLEAAGLEVDHRPDRDSGSLADVIAPYTAVVVHSPHLVDEATVEAGERLRVVGRAGVGVDNIDVEAATRRGVLVMNLPWGNTITAAEHTMALLMALARNIPQAAAALRSGVWDRKPYLGVEVKGKSLGIVGLGRIGREVARRARAMEMEVLGADPFLSAAVAADLGVELLALEELLPRADFLTVHVPRTPDTAHLIDAAALQRIKPGARVLNCARGGIVDEGALLEALESGRLAGAACDVFETEPTDNEALLAHPRFIGTPHLGGATREARERVGEGIARQIADYLSRGVIRHAVNVQALPPEEQTLMQPYLGLGRAMGTLLSQCFEGVEALRIEYFGEITAYTTRALTAHVLAGFFRPFLGEQVNVVNALSVARDRGLQVDESKSTAERGYSSLVRVEARAVDGLHGVAGTVFDGDRPRLVELDGLPIEMAPTGHLLIFANEDRPGVIADVSGFLAGRGINIADLRLGRGQPGGMAIAAVTLDQPLGVDGLQELRELGDIRWARTVEL
ncbi:MAG: phosphoglycerate dehydrogenase [Acidobacteriota bacterium]